MGKKRGERRRVQGRNVLESFFQFYALLAKSFSLTIWHAQQRGARRYVCTFITVLTASTIHLFHVEKFSSRFYAFRSALFGLSVFYANELHFQLFGKFFRRVLPIFFLRSGAGPQRTRPQH